MSVCVNWDDCEKVLHHTFYNELRVAPEETAVLATVPPCAGLAYKEKMIQILFETFSVPSVCLVDQAVLALYASGRTTGLVVMVGETSTFAVPIYEGCTLEYAAFSNGVGGRSVTDCMMKVCVN